MGQCVKIEYTPFQKGGGMKRKRYGNKLKAKVAVAAIKGDRTPNEIASGFGTHVSQINRWKKEALDQLLGLLDKKANINQARDAEKEKDILCQQIGKLQVEVE